MIKLSNLMIFLEDDYVVIIDINFHLSTTLIIQKLYINVLDEINNHKL